MNVCFMGDAHVARLSAPTEPLASCRSLAMTSSQDRLRSIACWLTTSSAPASKSAALSRTITSATTTARICQPLSSFAARRSARATWSMTWCCPTVYCAPAHRPCHNNSCSARFVFKLCADTPRMSTLTTLLSSNTCLMSATASAPWTSAFDPWRTAFL